MPYGLDLLTADPNPADRTYVPLMQSRYTRYRFDTQAEADAFAAQVRRSQRDLDLRVVPIYDEP